MREPLVVKLVSRLKSYNSESLKDQLQNVDILVNETKRERNLYITPNLIFNGLLDHYTAKILENYQENDN